MKRFFDFASLSVLVLVALPVEAANFDDPTWPCIQRKVPNLSIGQMWSGPILDPDDEQEVNDESIDTLAAALAVRRTSMEEAEKLIDDFARAAEGEDKNMRLARLFAAVFERINTERGQLISGIGRYSGKQIALSDRIGETNEKVVALEAKEDKSNDEWDRLEELVDTVEWDTRIYEERQQSLIYVCETPVILEKRAFALARLVMQHLD